MNGMDLNLNIAADKHDIPFVAINQNAVIEWH